MDVAELLGALSFGEAQFRAPGVPYAAGDLLAHLRVSTRASLDLASGKAQAWPEELDLWPAPPATEAELGALVLDLRLLLAEASALAGDPSDRARELLTDLAAHNAYHWGQVALLRRLASAEGE